MLSSCCNVFVKKNCEYFIKIQENIKECVTLFLCFLFLERRENCWIKYYKMMLCFKFLTRIWEIKAGRKLYSKYYKQKIIYINLCMKKKTKKYDNIYIVLLSLSQISNLAVFNIFFFFLRHSNGTKRKWILNKFSKFWINMLRRIFFFFFLENGNKGQRWNIKYYR